VPFGFSTIVIVIVILYLLSSVKILAEYERGVIFHGVAGVVTAWNFS
jgi:uncharacterized MnhB-related membrane protein